MTGREASLTIAGDDDQVRAIASILDDAGATVQTSQIRQLDGAAATSWIAVASIAIPVAPALLDSLREFLTRDRAKRLRVKHPDGAELEIDNPDAESVAKVIDFLSSREDA